MTKSLRLLIVEDSEDDAELIVNQLERSGYAPIYQRVDNVTAMTTALAQQWDVVLADYSLPGFSATAALNLLRQHKLDLPFIIVSGCIGDESAVAAMKAGAHDYIMKGNLTRLVPAIERELKEAASRRENKQIQSELKESEDRWQLALRGANDGIWDWNLKTNEVFFSARWKEMLGYANDELANHSDEWLKLVHPDDVSMVTQALQDHLSKKTQFYSIEHRLLCKDGSYKWILSRAQALWNEAGEAIRLVGSHTDINSTKQMESALRQQAKDLAEANRLKDEFLAVVSHELRTPLNSILGWSKILQNRKLEEQTTIRALETIERNAKLQKQLVEDILDVSSIIQGKVKLTVAPVNLTYIIKLAAATVQTAAQAKSVELKLLLDDSVPMVNGDADRLQQVMWNLISNAIKFTPVGGVVEVKLSMVMATTNFAQIQISDTGIGIKPEFLPYVFDRFSQEDSSTTRTYGGLGLGLALVRHLLELHGGTVNVDSPGEGQGTTFTVKLPLLQDTSGNGEMGRWGDGQNATPSPLDNLQVLVVDDDADNREFLVFALTNYGADVLAAASAREALAALQKFHPDVIVSDIGMPDENGYDLIRQVRSLELEQGGSIPAIALTGYARDSDRDQALDAGFQFYLSKPVDPNELVEAIAQFQQSAIANYEL